MIEIRYFASLRDRLGVDSEQIDAINLDTVADIIHVLKDRGGVWQSGFDGPTRILAAVNHEMVRFDHAIKSGDEVAFFPPVTGG